MELTGQKFGRLTVVQATEDARPGRWWMCRCDCGNTAVRSTSKLRAKPNGHSCGCVRADSIQKAAAAAWAVTTRFTHPLKSKLKMLRSNMLRRCYTPTNKRYACYGGRGIKVCEEWRNSSLAFYEWALAAGFQDGLTLERKDVNSDYCPENCCFIPMEKQQLNTTRSRRITFMGKTQCVAEWAREAGMSPRRLEARLRRGWSIERAITKPLRK